MGRHPTPTKMLEFRKGKIYDKQRDRGELEPKPYKEVKPRCPARFSKTESKAWKDISMVLKNYGLFTAANALQLELLSTAWAQYLEASKKLSENPSIIVPGPQNGWMYNPWFNAQHKLGNLVDKYSQNLGLSSMQLAKMGSLMLKKKKESDSMESLLD